MAVERKLWKVPAAIVVVVLVVGLALLLGTEAGHYVASKRNSQRRSNRTQSILAQMNTLAVGDTLPDHPFEDLDHKELWLRDLLSEKTLISFTAPDCDACLAEFDELAAAVSDSADRRYFLIIWPYLTGTSRAQGIEHSLSGRVLYDKGGEFLDRLAVNTFPFNLIVNLAGAIEEIIADPMDREELAAIITANKAAEAGQK